MILSETVLSPRAEEVSTRVRRAMLIQNLFYLLCAVTVLYESEGEDDLYLTLYSGRTY